MPRLPAKAAPVPSFLSFFSLCHHLTLIIWRIFLHIYLFFYICLKNVNTARKLNMHTKTFLVSSLQHETRVLRVKVIAGIDLAKKDIIGARWVRITPFLFHWKKSWSLFVLTFCSWESHSTLDPLFLPSFFRLPTLITNQWLATSLTCAPHIPVLNSVSR